MKWIYEAPTDDDIDADNDGPMSDQHGALIDLSDLASQVLGQQVTQHTSYTIRRIQIALNNVDDVDDNDESNYFKGDIRCHYPTKHKLNAIELARLAEKAKESTEVDADSFLLSIQNDYSAMRFGWSRPSSAWENDQVRYQTAESFSGVAGTQWSLQQLFDIYNVMYPQTKANSLWQGRADSASQKMQWTCSVGNADNSKDNPAHAADFQSGAMNMKALCGLLFINVRDSGGDEYGTVDDDYKLRVTVEFDVGVDA